MGGEKIFKTLVVKSLSDFRLQIEKCDHGIALKPIDSIHSIFKEIYRRHQFSDSNQSRCVSLIKSSRNNEVRKSQIGTEYT